MTDPALIAKVSLVQCASYREPLVDGALHQLLLPLGGLGSFVAPGQRVLIKPNLLAAAPPEAAVTTHPALLYALVRQIRQLGAVPLVGDSPADGDSSGLAEVTGIAELCRRTGMALAPFDVAEPLRTCGHRSRSLPVASELHRVDVLINVAKLKTHSLTGLTGAVKNLYGLVVGGEKQRLHLKHPLPYDFANLLLDIALAVRPTLSIVDAVVGMEGPGPRSGRPRHIGLLLAGTDPVALDTVAAALLGFGPGQVATQTAASRRKLPGARLGGLDLHGPQLSRLAVRGFDRGPGAGSLASVLGRLPLAWVVNAMASRQPYPQLTQARCTKCGECARHCPPQVMDMGQHGPSIRTPGCIRCYCCLEVCPEAALQLS